MTTHPGNLLGPVRRAAVLLAVQGVGLVGVGGVYAVAGLLGEPEDRLATVLEGGFGVVAGLLVLLVARGVRRGRPWSLSPAVVVQLFSLVVASGLAQGRVWVPAVVVAGLALAVLSQLFQPQARLAFREAGPTPR